MPETLITTKQVRRVTAREGCMVSLDLGLFADHRIRPLALAGGSGLVAGAVTRLSS